MAASLALFFVFCLFLPSDAGIPVRTKTIVNVGGSGSYDEIVGMPCGSCDRRPKFVSGCLSPFDEEQTLKLRGPMEVSEIGVYYPSGAAWNRVSYFNRGGVMDNIVAMGSYGRSLDGRDVDESSCHTMPGQQAPYIVNGDDFMCHGYNTSYASSDGKCASKSVVQFAGRLEDGVEVNFMQSATCDAGCGFYRGAGQRGWEGVDGSKMFAAKLRYTYGGVFNSPAVWFLHASVPRTANYEAQMCNCRGMGSPGGCGELDVAEVVTEQNRKDDLDTTIYSFKGAQGDQYAYKFEREMDREIVYVTIFNREGYIQILQLDSWEFSFDGSVSNAVVDDLNSRRELVIKMPGEMPAGCGGPRCDYMMAQSNGFAARVEDGVVCDDAPTSSEPDPTVGGFVPSEVTGFNVPADKLPTSGGFTTDTSGGFTTDTSGSQTSSSGYPTVTTFSLPASTGCIPASSGLPDSYGGYHKDCDGSSSTANEYTLANGGYTPGRRLKVFS